MNGMGSFNTSEKNGRNYRVGVNQSPSEDLHFDIRYSIFEILRFSLTSVHP